MRELPSYLRVLDGGGEGASGPASSPFGPLRADLIHKSDNPRSSAFGIAQRLRETDRRPEIQILHGLRYIEHRYGSPCAARAFFSKHRWY
jgi:hypothetical protein